jgi:paraquat-inducible protein B
VDFRGVQIGTVSDIKAVVDPKEIGVRMPVTVEIARDKLEWVGERPEKGTMFRQIIERGVRGQLQVESMVTGQYFIQLDFHPEAPATELHIDPLTKLPEIPTVPTTIQQVQHTVRKALEKFGELPLEEIVNHIHTTLQGIDRLVNSPDLQEGIHTLNTTLTDIGTLARNLDQQLKPVTASTTAAMDNVSKLARNADGQVASLTKRISETLAAASGALAQAQTTLTSVDGFAAANSPVRYELVKTLQELSEAARALRILADYLERNPNAIVFGRNDVSAK